MSLAGNSITSTSGSQDMDLGMGGLQVDSSSASSVVVPPPPPLEQLPVMETDDVSQFLDFPRDYFGEKTGANPTNSDAAALLWPFRLGRPAKGAIDKELPNGDMMLQEVKLLHKNLRDHIHDEYLEEIPLIQ